MSKNKAIKLILKISISFIFISFLVSTVNIKDTYSSLVDIDKKFWIIGVLVYLLAQLLNAYKWSILASSIGFNKKVKEYINYYFSALFFNLFLPTTVGGDVIKCYYLSRNEEKRKKTTAVYSVLAERYTGVISIIAMGLIALFSPAGNVVNLEVKIMMLVFMAVIIVLTPFFPTLVMKYFKKKKWARNLLKDIRIYWIKPKLFFKGVYWSVLSNLLIVSIHIMIARAMGLNIPPVYQFIVYSMTGIAGFLPISFNGLGLREGTYVLFLSLIGIQHHDALAFSIFWFGIVLISSLIGGIFYLKGGRDSLPNDFDSINYTSGPLS